MSMRMNRDAYEKAVAENIEWLLEQPRTLEREHIIEIVRASLFHEYPPSRICGCVVVTCDDCLIARDAYRERNQP